MLLWRCDKLERLLKIKRESKRLGIISKSTLWYQKRKIWLKAKEPNLHHYFPKSSKQKGGVTMYIRTAKTKRFSVIFRI
jgi:hypothetical protein